jgi:hypothetical protein
MSFKELLSGLRSEREKLGDLVASLQALAGGGEDVARPTQSTPRIQLVEHYTLFRAYIQHEDGLINNRLLWNINVQGFLFATFGLAVQKLYDAPAPQSGTSAPGSAQTAAVAPILLHAIITVLPVFGIWISILSLVAVRAAEAAIQNLRKHWETVLASYPGANALLPRIIGGGLDSAHKAGLRAPFWVPVVFIGAWVFLLLAALLHLCRTAVSGKPIL